MPSAGARLESIASDALLTVFPVTDGDSSRWPEKTHPPAMSAREVNWFRKMTIEEKYVCRWRNLIGQGIAKLLDKPDKEKYCLQGFPEGYWMFDHNKGPVANIRHDLYLYGSKTVGRFRSPAEFIPHGYWLLTDPTLNNQNCGCKYCAGGGKKTQTEISEALGLPTNRGPTSVTGGIGGIRNGGVKPRPRFPGRSSNAAATASVGPWISKERRAPRKMDSEWRTTSLGLGLVANSTRISDLRSNRMFRQGELVWCLQNVKVLHTVKGKEIDHGPRLWPAIILDYGLDISVDRLSSLGLTDISSIIQTRQYILRRLGTRSLDPDTGCQCTLSENELLPWHAHKMDPSSSGLDDDSLRFALKTGDNLTKFWAVCDRLPIKVPLSTDTADTDQESHSSDFLTPVKQTPFPESSENPTVSPRSTPTISTPYLMATTPPQRSPVRLVAPSVTKAPRPPIHLEVVNAEPSDSITNAAPSQRIYELRDPKSKVATVTETRYQGLWYGAERIWTGDLVRLSPERPAFAESLRLSQKIHGYEKWRQRMVPAPGANTRGVLIRIDKIFVRIGENGTKECAVSGPLYEIVPEDWTDTTNDSKRILASSWQSSLPPSTGLSEKTDPWNMAEKPPPRRDNKVRPNRGVLFDVPPLPSPVASSGYTLRPLLPLGFEIPVPISYIAGRYYPDILQATLLSNVIPYIPKKIRSLGDFMSADWRGVQLMSLCALAPGRYNHAVCVDVRLASRTGMLREAIRLSNVEPEQPEYKNQDSRVQEHVMDLG